MSITIGWWAVPAGITIIALFLAHWASARISKGSDPYGISSLVAMFFWAPAIFVSLIAWLIYAFIV